MTFRLLVGPSGSGKTTRALETFKQFTPSEHLSSARLIVPTVSDVLQIRRLMLSDPEFPGILGDPICTFPRFASDLLPNSQATKTASYSPFSTLLTKSRPTTSLLSNAETLVLATQVSRTPMHAIMRAVPPRRFSVSTGFSFQHPPPPVYRTRAVWARTR